MTWSTGLILSVLIFFKLLEHAVSRANEVWLRSMGGSESEGVPYIWFGILQILFYLSLFVESSIPTEKNVLNFFWLTVVLFIVAMKIWCMQTKGTFWNLKGVTIKRIRLIKKGPYKKVRHPEYWILAGELIAIPLVFQLHVTMVLFLLLHCSLLIVQLPGDPERKVS